jgi:integrase/recombinase XerD
MEKARSTGLTLLPYVRQYVHQRTVRGDYSKTTAKNVTNTLTRFAISYGKKNLNRLSPAAVDQFLDEMGDVSRGTKRLWMSQLKLFLQWMVDTKNISKHPMKGMKPPRRVKEVPVTLTEREVARLLDVCGTDQRKRVMVWLMVGLGARCCEVSNLLVDHYDGEGRTILLNGKGGHQRILPVPAEVARQIDAYLREVGRVSGAPMIRARGGGAPGRRGAPSTTRGLAPQTVSWYMRLMFDEADIKVRAHDGKSAHALRRTAASDVLERTNDLLAVQRMLGHAKLETTAAYLRAKPDDVLRAAMEGRTYSPPPPDDDDGLAGALVPA